MVLLAQVRIFVLLCYSTAFEPSIGGGGAALGQLRQRCRGKNFFQKLNWSYFGEIISLTIWGSISWNVAALIPDIAI